MPYIEKAEPGQKSGTKSCPGVDEYGHGLTMTIIHLGGCCDRWETSREAAQSPEPDNEREAG